MPRAWLSIGLVALATLLMLPFQLAAIRWGVPDPGIVPRWHHRLSARLLGLRITVEGRPPSGGPLLVVSNHASWIDIVVLGALVRGRFVARADMAGWPGVGHLARLSRTIFVDRERRGTTADQSASIAARLAAGDIVVLFPEGTTSDGNGVLGFNTSLFGAARKAVALGVSELPIQPVTIAYTRLHGIPMGRGQRRHAAWIGDEDLAPHLMARLKGGAVDVSVSFGEPVAFTAASDRKAVARALEAEIRERFIKTAWGG